MKQAQFRRAAQSPGFRPIQVSGAEISRMREESARVVQGMRNVRDAEIQNRERELSEVKENQRSEAASRERNYQIQTQNQQRELSGLQLEARARQQQFTADQEAAAQIFKSVANISETAGKVYGQYVEIKENKQINEALLAFEEDPNKDKFYSTLLGEQISDELEEQRQSRLDEAEVSGADPLAVAKSRNYSDRVQREIKKGKVAYFLTNEYPTLLNKQLKLKEQELGRPLTSAEVAAESTQFKNDTFELIRTQGGIALKPATMRTALAQANKSNQSILNTARDRELKAEKQISLDNATTILTQNPTEFATNIIPSFRAVYRANGYDYAKAHDWYESLATSRGPDGNFLFTEEQLASVVLTEGEKPYKEQRPARFSNMMRARQQDDNSFRQQQITSDNLAYKEAEQKFLAGFAENPTKAYAEESRAQFLETFGRVPESLNKALNSYTIEAQTKAKQIEQIESIPDGFIRQVDVDALSYLDPTAARNLDKRFQAQERKYKQGIFKDQSDSFKTVANGVTSFGSQKPNTPASVFLQQQMRAEYRRRVDQAVAGGADFNTAANTIAQQLSSEVSAGARDPNSKWYRKPSKPGGSADFPNLNTGAVSAVEQSKRNYNALVTSIGKDGLEKTLDTPGSIITAEEGASILQTYGKPGFVIPTDVLAVAGMGKGTDPFTIINKQLKALDLPELDPPQITQDINNELSPELRQEIYNNINGPRQKMRALEKGSTRQTGNVSRFRNSGSMRAGSPMRRTAGSREENAFIQTIRTVEGTSGPQGYNTVYGGAVVPQLTQMTLGELYDAIKLGGTDAIPARLGGGKIPFKKDRYNSSASGALQLMPETLRGLVNRGGYSWNDIFSPETQDRMIIDLARQGGVDIENMSPSQMSKAGNIWAGASPRYGQTTRTASDSYNIYQRLLQQ